MVFVCGLDPGNLKFETVLTHKQQICFWDLRRSIWSFAIWNYEKWPQHITLRATFQSLKSDRVPDPYSYYNNNNYIVMLVILIIIYLIITIVIMMMMIIIVVIIIIIMIFVGSPFGRWCALLAPQARLTNFELLLVSSLSWLLVWW